MPASAVASLLARTLDWIKARAARDNEMAMMSHADLQLLATDIGVTEADLRDILPRIGDHSELLDRMLMAHGLDPSEVRRAFAGVIRDLEATCARCRETGVCQRALESGTATARRDAFCPNADSIDALLASPAQL
jgi:hypothetical protein